MRSRTMATNLDSQPEPNENSSERVACDLSDFPEEVVGYVLDQLPDRLDGHLAHEEVGPVIESIEADYDQQAVVVDESLAERIALRLAREKLTDMAREVSRGERNDFTADEICALHEQVREQSRSGGA